MPTLWFVKDGRAPHTQSGEGLRLSFDQVRTAFGNYAMRYVAKGPPDINPDNPSKYPERVLIEVKAEEGTNHHFPKVGFYLASDLSPDEAQRLLSQQDAKGK